MAEVDAGHAETSPVSGTPPEKAAVHAETLPIRGTPPEKSGGVREALFHHTPVLGQQAPDPDIIPPVVSNFLPSAGSTIEPDTVLQFDVTEETGAANLLMLLVMVDYPETGDREVVFDTDEFAPLYEAFSTRTGITNGFQFKLTRSGGWPSDPRLLVKAKDNAGNEST